MATQELPQYFLRVPKVALSADMVASFERLFAEAVEHGEAQEIDYTLAAPKWQFLCYLADNKNVVLHGSGDPDIKEFEPRQSNDTEEFGNRKAVYAASDGLWPMYFAIVDRDKHVKSLVNACFRLVEEDESRSGPYYFFSINDDALPHEPWRNGTVYILPRDTFEQQEPGNLKDLRLEIAQWASLVPVKPLAKLAIEPQDFPFLKNIRGHDIQFIQDRATHDREGFPWIDE